MQHITNLAVKPQLRPFPVIHTVNQYPSLCRFKETPHQVHKGRLSRPCLTHNGNIHAGRHMKVKMFQHVFLPVRVHKGNILKHNVSLDFFPIPLIRRKCVSVLSKHIGSVHHIRLLFQQIHHPLNICLTGNQLRQQSGKLLYGFKYNNRIRDKYRQRPQFNDIFLDHIAALCQHHS